MVNNSDPPLKIFYAAINGNVEAIKHALSDGAQIEARAGREMTALFWAAHGGHPAAIIALLEAGAEVNALDVKQRTPLHTAAVWHKTMNAAKILLAAGADPTLKDTDNDTPIVYARIHNHDALAEYLQAIADNALPRPAPEEVGLNIHKRIESLETLGKPLGAFTHAERVRKAQRKTREAQRRAALRGEGI